MRKEKREATSKDFDRLLADDDLAKLRAVFDACNMKGRGGLGKWAALSFEQYPGNPAHWFIEESAGAADAYGNTALHVRICSRRAYERCTSPVHGSHPRRLPARQQRADGMPFK
ncbi:hypothetical protein [Burkholderia sp. Ac-20392]|uniref:hypothetical protein n=1 Tax=Burkholderia sp. Ac-20392 TaxID=2703905 RepID=UPI001980C8EB|nr:hypothetical protein [Burkholderia sp. Ac-20392]MBN3793745.1 hypothetical protein [Burkholderia sp. Ac-20392]